MYKVSKVLDHGFLLRWKGYSSKYDSWVDESKCNQAVKLVYFNKNQGIQSIRQTLQILICQHLNILWSQAATGAVKRKVSVTMPMDKETFSDLFGCLPSAPNDLRQRQAPKLSVPATELDVVFNKGWLMNTFMTSTTCQVMLDKPVDISLLSRKKVHYDHSACPHCTSDRSLETCVPSKTIVMATTFVKLSFYRERSKRMVTKRVKPTLSWAKDWRTEDITHKTALFRANKLK